MPVNYALPGQRMTGDRADALGRVGQIVFKATRDNAQSISSAFNPDVANALSWETVELDDLGGWSAGSPTRYTAAVAGWYELVGDVSFAANTSGRVRGAAWYVNGSIPPGGHGRSLAATPSNSTVTCAARELTVLLGVGDYVQLVPVQETSPAVALDTGMGGVRPLIHITYARPAV